MSDDQKLQEAKATIDNLSSDHKAEVGIQAVDTLPTGAIDAKKNIASAALDALPPRLRRTLLAKRQKTFPWNRERKSLKQPDDRLNVQPSGYGE